MMLQVNCERIQCVGELYVCSSDLLFFFFCCFYIFFFFFKQKTAYEIYQCDWSSDVCSSDLPPRDNYLRDVFDSAQAISYVNQTVRKAISRRGFTPYDYDLVASKREFDPDALFLEIEITIDFKGSDPDRKSVV